MNKEACTLTVLVIEIVLVDGDHYGKGYVIPIVVNEMRSYFYQSGGFLSKSSPHYMIL